MREIKFRVWNQRTKEFFKHFERARLDLALNYYEITPKVSFPEQYTGVKDKNGVEIYEGDIIKTCSSFLCEIVFKDGGFCYKKVDSYGFEDYIHFGGHKHLSTILDCEVIGNIHENPELLEDK